MPLYEVDCEDIVDLTDDAELDRHGVPRGDLSCPWEAIVAERRVPPSWALARRFIAAGAAGIVVPSFAPDATETDVNVAFWHWSGERPHRVRVIDDWGRLPRDDRSWGAGSLLRRLAPA